MQTNTEDTKPAPPGKEDWVRFGALEVQAKSKEAWRITAIVAIIGIIAITITDGWLFMERELRFERMTNKYQRISNQSRTLRNQLKSVNKAINLYSQSLKDERNEKYSIAVEKGILQAQVDLLAAEVQNLENEAAENALNNPIEPMEEPTEEDLSKNR